MPLPLSRPPRRTVFAVEQLNELGFYGLPGAPRSPADLLTECRDGEALGFGSVFLSERFNMKEAVTLSGAAAACTTSLGITTGVTNHNTRHPIVTASYATTMHRLTGGRFALGLGRGMDRMFDAFGMPRITTAQMEDFAGLMRRLWNGEMVVGHNGAAGSWPVLVLDPEYRDDIPLLMSAFGSPRAGRPDSDRVTTVSSSWACLMRSRHPAGTPASRATSMMRTDDSPPESMAATAAFRMA